MGGGDAPIEFARLGLALPPFPERAAALAETVALVRGLWEEAPVTLAGAYARAAEARLATRPVQAPHVPLLIAGGGEGVTLRQVAAHADACNFGPDGATGSAWGPAEVRRKLAALHRHCRDLGRPCAAVLRSHLGTVVLAETEAAAAAKLPPRLGQPTRPAQRRAPPADRDGQAGALARRHTRRRPGAEWILPLPGCRRRRRSARPERARSTGGKQPRQLPEQAGGRPPSPTVTGTVPPPAGPAGSGGGAPSCRRAGSGGSGPGRDLAWGGPRRAVVLRVTVYLKSGAAAAFEAEAVREAAGASEAAAHPKFRLDFAAPERGGRRLVYLDRDDVSAVVVEEAGADAAGMATLVTEAIGEAAAAGGDLLTVAVANAGEAPPGGPPRAP